MHSPLLGIFNREGCFERFELGLEGCNLGVLRIFRLRWLRETRAISNMSRQIVISIEVLAAQRTVGWSRGFRTRVLGDVTPQAVVTRKLFVARRTGSLPLNSHKFPRGSNAGGSSFEMLFELRFVNEP